MAFIIFGVLTKDDSIYFTHVAEISFIPSIEATSMLFIFSN